ncbi:Transposon TX1 uncharacterized 149 kDa protein [Vitis vinifera]|uniref:Transposon TX1 uncharacterized 149 kDa protein n=1 Tax=Vitis vinifera TaxID=29760 RepID=A0A438CCH9_VITVI|nr:Transposon TX1 uncharacterized 149 kDa protein [Vitis vinifera]
MGFFKDFHDQGKFVKSINASFMVLIPKKGGAEDLKDFRSISLVGSLYKLLAKVLANRLKKVMGKLVSKSQSAFVEGRQILDALLIANEAIHSMQKSGGGGILCKLDIEKAYDHVNWSFLLWLMEMMGFGAKWISWIQWCIGTVNFFLLVEESKGGGFLSGWQLSGRGGVGVEITHLLFADDTLVVNLDKSEIIAVGRVENVEEVALEFGCNVSKLPSSYLGLPLGARFKEVATWDGVEERLRKRLSIWKRQYISKGGRMTLIQSTLSSMPIYYKRKGGLGVRNLVLLNKTLLCKWSWRFAVEREALWRQVISAKYGEEGGGWRSYVVRGSYGVGLWKAIRRGWDALGDNLAYSVGNGRRVRFWKDKWCGDDQLCTSFPSLFAISLDKEAWVADVWSHYGGEVWAPRFSRRINDWEVFEVESLLLRLQGKRVYSDVEDQVNWTKAKNGRFSVKSLYKGVGTRKTRRISCKRHMEFFGASEEEESIDHILLHCGLARSLWSLLFSLFGVSWVLPSSIREALLGWLGPCVGKERKKVWLSAPLCFFLDCLEGKK